MKVKKCVAWVIGINKYANYPELRAAVNDATEFAQKLRRLGYDVVESIDDGKNDAGSYNKIIDKKQIFLDKILGDKVDVALLYFAGHGCMVNGEDCLILSDAASYINGSVKARDKSIVLKDLCKNMNANGDQMNILIVDACRTSVEDENRRGVLGYRDFGKNTRLPFQTLFAYSTSPEANASDGSVHSPYTQVLLDNMMERDLPIEDLFKAVRRELRRTHGRQIGQELTSLIDSYSFNYGQLDDGATLEYSENALADENFNSNNESFEKCINLFKSYYYYSQIDALDLFHKAFKTFTNDEKFVIGRNILQAAVGGCWKCQEELNYSKLKLFNDNGKNAVLDGIVYEMFFDSKNEFRGKNIKGISYLSEIDKLSNFDDFAQSFKGIIKVLAKYKDVLEYLPGQQKTYTVKVNIESQGKTVLDDNVWEISDVTYEGKSLLKEIALPYRLNKEKLRKLLCIHLAIPSSKLRLIGAERMEDGDILHPQNDIDQLLATI